jgi:hypothetical protein
MDSKWSTDWSKCCLCQQYKKDLKSPVTNPSKRDTDGYTNIATNIPLFVAIKALPISLDPARLDEGGGIEDMLRRKSAKYHQSCRLLFNNTKLQRAEKRAAATSAADQGESGSYHESRSKRSRAATMGISQCFLCDSNAPEGTLRQAMTMQLNERLNRCAKRLNDGKLLAILSAGDIVSQELKYHPACLVALYNRERAHLVAQECATSSEKQAESSHCIF